MQLSLFAATCWIIAASFATCMFSTNAALASDIFLDVNNQFRQAYSDAKKETLDKIGPVILITASKLTFLRNGTISQFTYVPKNYAELKTIDHIPLTLFILLNNFTARELPDKQLEFLQAFKNDVVKVSSQLANSPVSKNMDRQRRIIEQSLSLLDHSLRDKFIKRETLMRFTKTVSKDVSANLDEAVALELNSLDECVRSATKDMDAAEWKRLHVVIVSSHMPRNANRAMQYFQKLLGEDREGRRIICMEGPDDNEKALDLLATHVLDFEIGTVFFGDPWRMHSDLLSRGATKYLRKHKIDRH